MGECLKTYFQKLINQPDKKRKKWRKDVDLNNRFESTVISIQREKSATNTLLFKHTLGIFLKFNHALSNKGHRQISKNQLSQRPHSLTMCRYEITRELKKKKKGKKKKKIFYNEECKIFREE